MAKMSGFLSFSGKMLATGVAVLLVLSLFGWYFRIDLRVDDPYAWHVYMGYQYQSTNNIALSTMHFRKAIALDESRPDAHLMMGRYYYRIGDIDKVAEEIAYLKDYPRYTAEYHFYSGYLLQRMGRLDEAIGQYNDALKKNYSLPLYPGKDWCTIYLYVGIAYLQLGNYSEAVRSFSEGIGGIQSIESGKMGWMASADSLGAMYAARGMAYRGFGKEDQAEKDFNEGYRLNPGAIEQVHIALADGQSDPFA